MKQRQSKRRMTRVFHVVNPTLQCPEIPFAEPPDAYALVAEVDTFNVGQAFALTNNIEQDWTLNQGVRAFVESCRSTSVGDVIITPDDQAHLVLGRGFCRLGKV